MPGHVQQLPSTCDLCPRVGTALWCLALYTTPCRLDGGWGMGAFPTLLKSLSVVRSCGPRGSSVTTAQGETLQLLSVSPGIKKKILFTQQDTHRTGSLAKVPHAQHLHVIQILQEGPTDVFPAMMPCLLKNYGPKSLEGPALHPVKKQQ